MTQGPPPTETPAENASSDFLIVGLGGSAGAVASFREFFRNVPADSGMAYVVILHLSPDHESRLAEVLQGAAKIPVVQVREPVRVQPDRVYVIPPNKSLTMNDGTLVLSDVNGYQERRAPIDIFFRTLADTHDSRAVCAVMSGSGADGSMGLRRVKEYSGLVLVQDPAEAAFDDMPRHCIATGLVDFVVPVGEMPRRILEYRDQIAAIHIPEDPNERAADDDHALKEVFSTLRLRTGHDFTNYKRATVLRRIERRIAVRNLSTLPEYADFLRERHDESHALLRELLISVTNFFRDPVGLGPRREAPDPEADREEAVRRSPARLGSGLRDGGGGVHDRHAPRRACLIGRPDFRDRSRRARHRPRAQRLVQQGRGRGRAARAFAPLFSQRTGRISHPPRAARDGAVRASQRH